MTKLNLGAGYRHVPGYKNVDFRKETKPDYLVDLEKKGCLKAIKANSIDEVFASHVLEHIRNIEGLMSEVYRVCKNGAKMVVVVPYWSHHTAVEDPTHVRYFTEKSMMYYCKDTVGSDGKKISIPYNFILRAIDLTAEEKFKKMNVQKLMEEAKYKLNVIRQVTFVMEVRK
jgi:predicted SAM-dependent methyltransferase